MHVFFLNVLRKNQQHLRMSMRNMDLEQMCWHNHTLYSYFCFSNMHTHAQLSLGFSSTNKRRRGWCRQTNGAYLIFQFVYGVEARIKYMHIYTSMYLLKYSYLFIHLYSDSTSIFPSCLLCELNFSLFIYAYWRFVAGVFLRHSVGLIEMLLLFGFLLLTDRQKRKIAYEIAVNVS